MKPFSTTPLSMTPVPSRPFWTLSMAAIGLLLTVPAMGTVSISDWTYQGQLRATDGHPAEGLADIELRFLDVEGARVYIEHHPDVLVSEGLFALRLGDGEPLSGGLENLAAKAVLVEVLVEDEALGPPEPVLLPGAERGLAIDPPSPELRVFDRYGQPLGIYAGERVRGSEQYFAHDPGSGLTFALLGESGELGLRNLEIFYETPDCGGQGFVSRALSGVVFAETDEGYLVGTATHALRPLTVRATRSADGRCHEDERDLGEAVPITAIEAISLPLPAAAPLHVGVVSD